MIKFEKEVTITNGRLESSKGEVYNVIKIDNDTYLAGGDKKIYKFHAKNFTLENFVCTPGFVNEIKQVPGTSIIVARDENNFWMFNYKNPRIKVQLAWTETHNRYLPLKILFPEPFVADGPLDVIVEDIMFVARYQVSADGMNLLLDIE